NSFTPVLPAWLLGIPIVWHLHGIPYPPSPWERILLRLVSRFVAISDYIAREAKAQGFSDDISVILNPAPPVPATSTDRRHQIVAQYGIDASDKLVAHIGRLIPWKGQMELLRALKRIVPHYPRVTALIIGNDAESFGGSYSDALRRYVQDNELERHVRF